MINIRNINKVYGDRLNPIAVLRDVSLAVKEGEFVAIMGPSGSGKSTLLNIVGCLDLPDGGFYKLGDITVSEATEDQLADIRNSCLGFVFQSFNLIPRMDVMRNVELPMVYANVGAGERRERALGMLERVGLADKCKSFPAQLSGGQKQRVAIARALVNTPDVLIADEPTGSLDGAMSHDLMDLFTSLNEDGKTIVMVTHENDIAARAKRIIRLKDGQVVESGLESP